MYNNDPMGILSSDRHLEPLEASPRVRKLLDQLEIAESNIKDLKEERDEFLRDLRYKQYLTFDVRDRIVDMVIDDYDHKISIWRMDIDAYKSALATEGAL